jgi:hypothetical protein
MVQRENLYEGRGYLEEEDHVQEYGLRKVASSSEKNLWKKVIVNLIAYRHFWYILRYFTTDE